MKPLLTLLLLTATLFANIPLNTHDAQDHRIAKIVEGTTTTYLVDPNTPYARVIHESRDNGTEIDYSYGLRLLNNGEHTFLGDALGSTRALADGSGQITDSYDYSPYGTLLRHSGSSDNPFLFTGEQYDPEAGLYYLRARYYSPELARFLTRDTYNGKPIDPLSQNHYLYAGGNPVVYVDPSGHESMLSMNNAIAVMGILTGGAIVTHLFDMRGQGSSYGAYDVVIDSYFYNFDISYSSYELINGEEGIEIDDRSESQKEEEAQRDHDAYKKQCSNRPRRSQFDNGCDYYKALLEWSIRCKNAVEEFDRKWKDKNRPDGHADTWIKDMENNIRKAKKFISKKGCK